MSRKGNTTNLHFMTQTRHLFALLLWPMPILSNRPDAWPKDAPAAKSSAVDLTNLVPRNNECTMQKVHNLHRERKPLLLREGSARYRPASVTRAHGREGGYPEQCRRREGVLREAFSSLPAAGTLSSSRNMPFAGGQWEESRGIPDGLP